jgi:signal transduction histidine kinase
MITSQELARLELFADTTDDELQWLVDHSREQLLAMGEYYVREDDLSAPFYVVLEGELQILRNLNGQPTVMGTTPRGIIGGEIALLKGTRANMTARALLPSRLMTLDVAAFRAMFGACPTVGARVLQIATQRSSGFTAFVKQQEKMAALGKLSAGLAHELNNPAAAARRATASLREALPRLHERTVMLCVAGLDSDGFAALIDFKHRVADRAPQLPPLSTIARSEHEDELSDWLSDIGVANAWEIAPILVSAGVTVNELVDFSGQFPPKAAPIIVTWLGEALTTNGLLDEIEQTSTRISELVRDVKAYTYMDQGQEQDVDINQGLETTLSVFNHKLKNMQVSREYASKLPKLLARGGELNQVWTNLIDNAIDATEGKGALRLITRCEQDFIMVEIADNGPGISPDVLPRIFEPFFTTKGVGVGTGLGLDISYRIVQQHGGSIEVQSQPGNTRFIVRLPVQATSVA